MTLWGSLRRLLQACRSLAAVSLQAESSMLEEFGTDLTEKARKGKLDPVIGRAAEIERVMQVLSRRQKNNPLLMGEPGVGKTAVVEGLAQLIVAGQRPGYHCAASA